MWRCAPGSPSRRFDEANVVIGDESIPCRTVIWTAGVTPSPAGKWLNAPTDKAGRVRVEPDCSVAGHPEVFVIGDTASLNQDGKPLPGVAQVAMQQGRFVGHVITNRVTGRPAPPPFRYFDGARPRVRIVSSGDIGQPVSGTLTHSLRQALKNRWRVAAAVALVFSLVPPVVVFPATGQARHHAKSRW